MAIQQDLPATDSATVLHELVGDDATASFESDPTFAGNNPGDAASSNHLQTRAERLDIQSQPDLAVLAAVDEDDDEDEEEEDDEDEDEDELDDEDDDDDEDELDDEDEDEDELDDDEDEEEDEDEDDA